MGKCVQGLLENTPDPATLAQIGLEAHQSGQ